MIHSRHFFIYRTNLLADLGALGIAILISAKIAGGFLTGFSLRYMLEMRFSLLNGVGGLLLALVWIQIFRSLGLYRPRRPTFDVFKETWEIAVATAIGTFCFASASFFFNIRLFDPLFFVVFWPLVTILEVLSRMALQGTMGRLHLGDKNQRNVLIVGTNEIAWEYASRIQANPGLGYNLLGFVDDLVVIAGPGMRHLGELKDFSTLLKQHVIDEVVIAMPMATYSRAIQEIIDHAHEQGIAVRFPMSQIFSGMTRNSVWRVRQEAMVVGEHGEFASDLVVYSGYQLGPSYLVKRLFDIVFATTLLIAVSPVLLSAAIAILLTDGWPVIFAQNRYGYNGRTFKLLKFRTMVRNAEALQKQLMAQNERDGAAFKMKNDPRVTRIGRFLRKTSIDELPQLFNVLRGEMSIVGPRPLPLADYERMDNLSHRRRLSVLPGITGPWQISGRDRITFEQWMQMDVDYIDNWRLSTDFKILLMTVPVVLFGRGAS